MSSSDWVTIVGVAVTIISMVVSIKQARNARRSSDEAKRVMATVKIAAIAERLKSAQEHIREVAPDKAMSRGFKVGNRFDLIRREFDTALSALPKQGAGSAARDQLAKAQRELNSYQTNFQKPLGEPTWQRLQTYVQDVVSDLSSDTVNTGLNQ